ncbi:hypothetical protein NNC19_20450 [Clostridium sp. SHJSY1]|uniref:hypothetical protein n=1 Tax=Clostridium sp. SHJSY1 TaxID=2942483 RepID=UPI002875FD04|nr:hypothetical protein [Clostridium sp. SHJSY1]MDS0528069.1 hypothetical protein [Clostridium sp. SHJSY1]
MDKFIESYNNWCENSNIFECYVKSTTLASLSTADFNDIDFHMDEINKNNFEKLKSKINSDLRSTFLISDLDPEENLDFSIMLNNDLDIKPILSFNHIAHDYGLVGNNIIHNKIVNYSLNFKNIENVKSYCFILDNSRYKNTDDYLNPLIFNNQYEITEEELPHVEVLKMMNIDKLIFIYRNNIKEDIQKYLDYLKEEKIDMTFINLDSK